MESSACVVWFTGLPASGKTTLADTFSEQFAQNNRIKVLDGDVIRKLNPSLGFSKEDRLTHLSQLAAMASELEKEGYLVLVSTISPYEEARLKARSMSHRFYLIYLSTPLDICISRDPKGLYKKALSGEIKNFTGVSDTYEVPQKYDLKIDTTHREISSCIQDIADMVFK